jgi:predicted nucleotidyltransferase
MALSEKTTVIEDLLREKREEILRIAEKHGARNVRIFGSVAHGEATEASDIDLLVDTAEQTSPWFPAGLAAELEELLGQRVDAVTSNGLYLEKLDTKEQKKTDGATDS